MILLHYSVDRWIEHAKLIDIFFRSFTFSEWFYAVMNLKPLYIDIFLGALHS